MQGEWLSAMRWDYWLLLLSFAVVASFGLQLSWRWNREATLRKRRSQLARRLALEVHGNTNRRQLNPSPTAATAKPATREL